VPDFSAAKVRELGGEADEPTEEPGFCGFVLP
jgi:hypothetical protein